MSVSMLKQLLGSQVASITQVVKTYMPRKGNVSGDCQQTYLMDSLSVLDARIDSINENDLVSNPDFEVTNSNEGFVEGAELPVSFKSCLGVEVTPDEFSELSQIAGGQIYGSSASGFIDCTEAPSAIVGELAESLSIPQALLSKSILNIRC